MRIRSRATTLSTLLTSLAVSLGACGDKGAPTAPLGPRAAAATLSATVSPPAGAPASAEPAAADADVLDLEPVDGMPVSPFLGTSAVRELPGPSTRYPACLSAGDCSFGDASDVWVETRDGFVTRWAVVEVRGTADKKEEDLVALAERLAPEMRARVVPGPVIELAESGELPRRAPSPVWLLAARVHSDEARAARLMVSVNSDASIVLNGQRVHRDSGDQFLLPDHRTVKVALVAGWNDIVVRLEKVSPYAVLLALRLRGLDAQPLAGLAWALPAGVARSPEASACDALAIDLAPALRADGWRIGATITKHGLLPWPHPQTVTLRHSENGASSPSEGLAVERSLDGDAIERELVLEVPAQAATLTVTLDGATCLTRELREVPRRQRYLAARALVDALDPKSLAPGDAESLAYQADDVRALLEAEAFGDAARRTEGALAHLEAHARAAHDGKRPFQEPGVHVRAYRSRYDGSLQRYVVLVPAAYRKGDAAPLVMLAHGLHYTPEDMLRIALAKPSGPGDAYRNGSIYQWDPPEPPNGAILVAHDGYRNAGQRAPGEVDVRRVIDEMKAAYRIDRRRVSISGFSLGGSVAFWVPFHAFSAFSAAAPLCGYPNITEYRSVKRAQKRPWEERLLDEDGVFAYADGGKYLPLWMVHGSMDGPSRSELIHERYKTLRYPSQLDIPKLGHNVWDKAFEDGRLLKWLAARRRPAVAPQPVVRAGRYRWAENYWLRIDRFQDRRRFGELGGRLKGERIEVSTQNVDAFTLLGDELGDRASKPQTVVIDGKALGERVIGSALSLSRAAGTGWRIVDATSADDKRLVKRPGLEGPLNDAWYGPLVVVYGTQLPSEIEANRLAAERLAMHSPWIDLRVPIFADVDVLPGDIADRSVILVGRPATNSVTALVAPDLEKAGIRFSADGSLDVAGRRFEGPEIGISVIRPSPLSPGRYLVLHAGLGPDGTLSSRYLPELAPDYLVYDSAMREVFADKVLGPRGVLMGGFFDDDWQFADAVPR